MKSILRISLLIFIAGSLSSCGGNSSEKAQTPEKPNIVFILVDDLSWGDIGCFGQKMIKTPKLRVKAKKNPESPPTYGRYSGWE